MTRLQFITYARPKGDTLQEFRIKKKDYGEMILYDIFYEDSFLFTISQNGEVLLSNWEDARKPPIAMDDATLSDVCQFIVSSQTRSFQPHP